MLESFKNLFISEFFLPHGHCYLWKPQLVWLHVASDSLIGLSYYSVSIMLFYFVHKRRDASFRWIVLMFGAFMIADGTGHVIAAWTRWHPDYWFFGGIELITAIVSLYMAAKLFTFIPKALVLPSASQLEAANQKLAQEIGERASIEAALKQSEARFRLIFENAAIGIVLVDVAGHIREINPAFQHMLGYSHNELCRMHFREFTHPEFIPVEEVLHQEMVAGLRDFYQLETLYICKEGELLWGHLTVSLVCEAESNPQFCLATIENITERKAAEKALQTHKEHLEELVAARTAELIQANEQLSWQASHDALTGLFNRRQFESCLEKAVSCARTSQQKSTLCYMDLDRFKIVNDTCGHQVGDELLRQISSLLQSRCRKTDTLARLGGDEFGLLLYKCSIEEAQRVVQTLYDSIQQFRFVGQDKTFAIGISIGLVRIDTGRLSPEEILNAADTACYTAKNRGRNQVCVYQVDEQELQEPR